MVESPSPIRVSTPGVVGAAFVPLDIAEGFSAIEFLYAVTDSSMKLRVSNGPAVIPSIPVVQPTLFLGGETVLVTIDELPAVTVTFLVTDQTLADVVNRINAALAAAGMPTPRAVAVGFASFKLSGIVTRVTPNAPVTNASGIVRFDSLLPSIPVSGGTVAAAANGNDYDVNGTLLVEFPSYPNSPTNIEVSGNGAIRVMIAGRTSP